MKKTLFSFNTVANNLNFSRSLKFFFICILNFYFSFVTEIQAQQTDPSQNISPTSIVLKEGVKLFSADETFNEQVLTKQVVLKNSEISLVKNKNREQSLSAVAKKTVGKDLESQLKIAELSRRKESFKKIKKEIDRSEQNREAFQGFDFKGFPSQNQFFSSNKVSKDCVSPTHNGHDTSKFYASSEVEVITRALDYLHSQKYRYYNNKSLDFCFSEVFSVRPPPVLV
ncbi:hypothetical protein OMO38_09005 [Chryseobacterium sp. 09-1422]|uniref:Uncharacterized protein n=1 Tax=Chryseobacterium kimseyorum TaxID=2984028 RepID=A0ABT3HY23_9FLAO|nr:hypothetical protein [Chryseobacterium kimseyorum]MCW3168666.1 hypothetical protein [Chryseobacterium kimseyorum]